MSPRRIAGVELVVRRIASVASWQRGVRGAELALPNRQRRVVLDLHKNCSGTKGSMSKVTKSFMLFAEAV